MEILLDCDGVLADFLGPSLLKLNAATGQNITLEDYIRKNTWDMESVYNIDSHELWRIIENDNHWLNLKPFPWSQELLDFCRTLGRVTICTTPTLNPSHTTHPECAAQKTEWLMKHFGIPNEAIMIGGRKDLMARPGNVLIDDGPHNTTLFEEKGGCAVLVPSNWNTPHLTGDMVLDTIKKKPIPTGYGVVELHDFAHST